MTLRTARLKANLTQEELAELSGVTQVTISALETGITKNPSWDTVSRLATALGTDPAKLFPVPDVKASA